VKSFEELYTELAGKVASSNPESSTVRLINQGVHGVGKKVVEEAAEAWMAAEHEGKERAAEEIAQLLYFTQVLMLASGVSLDDVYRRL
jgi:phosphoribosyl-ATP pyrophosphohydrolase